MMERNAVRRATYGLAKVKIYTSQKALGAAAAEAAVRLIQKAIQSRGSARVMAATGNSQKEFISALMQHREVEWERVEFFHMDEYAGMAETHPASFRLWIRQRIEEQAPVAEVHYIQADSLDLEAEIRRYAALLAEKPMDVAFVGFGENGHIAFNDPPVADFTDPASVKVVKLDDACRQQQTGEGHFPVFEDVPTHALTVTCTGLFSAAAWICCVPERRKAQAVKMALEGPVSTACPASLVRTHPDAAVFLDEESASLLTGVLEELRQREPIFHRPELGTSRADFESMMAPDFWDIGASGQRYERAYVLEILEERYARPHDDVWETSEFECRKLSDDVYLLTYLLVQDEERRTRRATIWQRTESGWQILYHQGTTVQES